MNEHMNGHGPHHGDAVTHESDHDYGYEEDMEIQVVELFDEEGVSTQFEVVANLQVDDREYAILEDPEDSDGVLIFRVTEENEEFVFQIVDDAAEITEVISAYEQLVEDFASEDLGD